MQQDIYLSSIAYHRIEQSGGMLKVCKESDKETNKHKQSYLLNNERNSVNFRFFEH